MILRGSEKHVIMPRMCIKSNFVEKIHSSSASSTSNWQLGGILPSQQVRVVSPQATYKSGWIGLKSVPTTCAEGYSSAMEYQHWVACQIHLDKHIGTRRTELNSPNPCSGSYIKYVLRMLSNGC